MTLKRFDCVDYEQDGPIVIIGMNNNRHRNSLNLMMRRGLNSTYAEFEDDDVRVAILTGVGNTFCSGQDTKDMVSLSDEEQRKNAAEMRRLSRTGAWEHRTVYPNRSSPR